MSHIYKAYLFPLQCFSLLLFALSMHTIKILMGRQFSAQDIISHRIRGS